MKRNKILRFLGYVVSPIILKALDNYSTFLFISRYGLEITLVKYINGTQLALTARESNPFFIFWYNINPLYPYLFGMLFVMFLFPLLFYLRKALIDIKNEKLKRFVSYFMDLAVFVSILGFKVVIIKNFQYIHLLETFL